LKELAIEGYSIDFKLLQNVPNSTVKNILRDVDLVIDELYSDTFMGGLGSEAAALGIPFLTFGFAKDEFAKWLDIPKALLIGYSDPITLKQKIVWAMEDSQGRKNLAQAQKSFQNNAWNSQNVANRFILLAKNDFPQNWIYKPSDIDYVWGTGMPKETLLYGLQGYYAVYGLEGLFLRGKPILLNELMPKLI
jgi:hypothetical protein